METPPADASLAAALGRVASGLYVLTARHGDAETGMLASWVQQCGFDPPQVTVALQTGRDVLEWLGDGAAFVLNVIPEDGKKLIAHFGKGFAPGEPAFEGLELVRDGDAPPALKAALAYLVCRVAARVEVGDHTLVVGRVTTGAVLADGKPAVHLRKNGLRY